MAKTEEKAKKEKNEKDKSNMFQNLLIKIVLLVVILLLLSLPVVFIKYNVGGVGEKARPLLEDIPYVQQILPPKPDPEDPQYMNKAELIDRYLTYKAEYEEESKLAGELTKELETLTDIRDDYQEFIDEQQKIEDMKLTLGQERLQLETDRENFFNDIKENKKTDFRQYFELIDKEKAQELYAEILQEEKVNNEIKEFASKYEKMEAEDAAKIFEEMGNARMNLIIEVLKVMKTDQVAEILASMDKSFAAKVTERMAEQYPFEY